MKILIVSDSHGRSGTLDKIVQAEPDAANVIFLGDGVRDMELIADAYPNLRVYSVSGNCDYMSYAPGEGLAPFDGALVMFTHGHLYSVKSTLYELAAAAEKHGVQAALYGHTHTPACDTFGSVTLFNPGAVCGVRGGDSRPCYGVMTVENGRASFEHKRLQ